LTDITEVGAQHVPDDRTVPTRHRPGRRGLAVIAAVLFVLLVAGIAYAVVMATRVSAFDQEQRDRADAVGVAQQFALKMDNVDGAHMGSYARSIDKLLTTKARTRYQKVFAQVAQAYEQSHLTAHGKVLTAGVGEADSDSATVLVVHDMTAKSDQGTRLHHYRWSVKLVKVDGRWLVDDFSEVG
jgi:predicted metalloprotease